MYNLTNLTTSENVSSLLKATNEITGGFLFSALLLAIFFIMVMGLKGRADFAESIAAASFVCFLLAGAMSAIGLLNLLITLFFFLLTALSALLLYTRRS